MRIRSLFSLHFYDYLLILKEITSAHFYKCFKAILFYPNSLYLQMTRKKL